jgi:hypothetical protein
MALRLIIEAKEFDVCPIDCLIEQKQREDGSVDKTYFIEGPFVQCNVKNRNGRNYPKELMEQCVAKYMAERMNPKFGFRSYGELGHPDGVEINLDKVSHYIQELKWVGNNCMGKAKVLTSHPMGRIVQTLLEEKLRLGTSTRGLGALSEHESPDGSRMVQSYEMIASDIVADPSAPQGFVNGILENKEYIVQENGVIVECYAGLEKALSVLPKDSELKNKLFLEAFEKFLKDFRVN